MRSEGGTEKRREGKVKTRGRTRSPVAAMNGRLCHNEGGIADTSAARTDKDGM